MKKEKVVQTQAVLTLLLDANLKILFYPEAAAQGCSAEKVF